MSAIITGYLKEIPDSEWVQEIIMERFDNALEMMTSDSIIYGGAVRDCLAGKELLGDLDIAINAAEFNIVSRRFHENPKWVPATEDQRSGPSTSGQVRSKEEPFVLKNSGDLAQALSPMSGICAFRTIGGQEVQLITSKRRSKDRLEDSIYVARMVDIICCGVIMLHDGRVFEALPGAYQDCLDGVLRLNEDSDTIYVDALPTRVEKLVGRGWKNTIDVGKSLKEVKLRQDRARRKAERNIASMHRKMVSTGRHTTTLEKFPNEIVEHVIMGGGGDIDVPNGYTSEISQAELEKYYMGDTREILRLLSVAAHRHKLNIRVKVAPTGRIYYITKDSNDAQRISSFLHGRKMEELKKLKTATVARFAPKIGDISDGKKEVFEKSYGGVLTGRTDYNHDETVERPIRASAGIKIPTTHTGIAERDFLRLERAGADSWIATFAFEDSPAEMSKQVKVNLSGRQIDQLKREWSRLNSDGRHAMVKRFIEISEGRE